MNQKERLPIRRYSNRLLLEIELAAGLAWPTNKASPPGNNEGVV